MTQSSLERTLAILDLFTEDRLEWTPEAMLDALGYSRPTLYRYLKTLRDSGFLVSLPGAGFTLGPRFVEFDFLLRKSDPLILVAQHHLKALAATHPCTALLVRWFGNRLLCVASECSAENPVSSYPRGRPMPLVRAAIGLGDDADTIHERFRQVRREGIAIARGEVTPGVVGIAAPIFDASRTPIASLCMTLAAEGATDALVSALATEIRGAAGAISDRLTRRRAGSDASAPADARSMEPT